MALFRNLFNRKGQLREKHAPDIRDAFMDMDEEDPDDEDESDRDEDNKGNLESDKPDEEESYEILEREILPEKIICPDCGGITLEGLDFCDKCGGELH